MNNSDQHLIQDLFLLQRVAQKINSNLDFDSLLEEIVNDVAQTFGYSRSAILMKDDGANELVIAAVRGWTVNYHQKGERFKIGEFGMVGHAAAIGTTYYAPDVRKDPHYRVSEEQTRSEIDIPLKSRGRLIGIFNAQHTEVDAFPPGRIQLLEALAGHIATAIENAQLFQLERSEKERMSKELTEARTIQRGLFPDTSPRIRGFAVSGTCLPCLEVGGDWYDYITLPDGRLAVVLADVSGKGLGAAMLMSSTRTVLRLIAENGAPPAEVLTRVNRLLMKDLPPTRFVTLIYAVLDPKTLKVVFASAGHCHPLLVDSGGPQFLDAGGGLPLGIQEVAFSEREVLLMPGSRLLLYSDGVTEAMDASSEQYGEARLADHARAKSLTVEGLLKDVRQFTNGAPASDDVTVVMIEASRNSERIQ